MSEAGTAALAARISVSAAITRGRRYPNLSSWNPLTKPVAVGSSIGLNHLPTWNEVICAIAVSTEAVLAHQLSPQWFARDGFWVQLRRAISPKRICGSRLRMQCQISIST